MYQLIYLDKEGNQFFLNLKTLEVAKINRLLPQKKQSKSKAVLSMFGIVSFCTTIIRIVKIDTSSNRVMLLSMVYLMGSILGVVLFLLNKRIQTKDLLQNRIDYSINELKFWIENGETSPLVLLKFCCVLFVLTTIISLIYYVDSGQSLMLVLIFVCWFILSFLLPEPLRFYWRNKGKMKKICQENNIEY